MWPWVLSLRADYPRSRETPLRGVSVLPLSPVAGVSTMNMIPSSTPSLASPTHSSQAYTYHIHCHWHIFDPARGPRPPPKCACAGPVQRRYCHYSPPLRVCPRLLHETSERRPRVSTYSGTYSIYGVYLLKWARLALAQTQLRPHPSSSISPSACLVGWIQGRHARPVTNAGGSLEQSHADQGGERARRREDRCDVSLNAVVWGTQRRHMYVLRGRRPRVRHGACATKAGWCRGVQSRTLPCGVERTDLGLT
ncbi:hypothetical protein BJ912DRAFT_275500 [Pholiota molesta]|nr:hypothetical protein BJ912DRAFT_275500 [Pholiota molesta]